MAPRQQRAKQVVAFHELVASYLGPPLEAELLPVAAMGYLVGIFTSPDDELVDEKDGRSERR